MICVNKTAKQILCLLLIIAVFLIFNLCIYQVFTKRCIDKTSDEMRAKSVEVSQYLPFIEESSVVKLDTDLELSGDLPVLDGAAALYPLYAGFVNAVYPEKSCLYDGEGFTEESAIQMNNTREAYKNVVNGKIDIAFCAGPSDEQLEYAKSHGVELEFTPIGSEAFVFVVNSQNPVEDLTVDKIQGIYSGKYTNWSQLGGENRLISALQRNEGSGSQTAMQSFMGDIPIKRDYNSFLGSSIGFSFRYYVEGIAPDSGVKILSLNGVPPTVENIQKGTYPIVNHFYAVYRKDNSNSNLPILINWILSDEGQSIVERTGYTSFL